MAIKKVEEEVVRPYIICHMMSSIDGKIDGAFFDDDHAEALCVEYEKLKICMADAWGNGSDTCRMYFAHKDIDFSKYEGVRVAYEDRVYQDKYPFFVCFDSKGKVNWDDKYVDYPNNFKNTVLEVLSYKVRPEYVAYLNEKKISYIFAGESRIDVKLAAKKLYELCGIKRFALCGGAKINGAFVKAGIVDEMSLLIAPYLNGNKSDGSIVNSGKEALAHFQLKSMEVVGESGVHLVYEKDKDPVEPKKKYEQEDNGFDFEQYFLYGIDTRKSNIQ